MTSQLRMVTMVTVCCWVWLCNSCDNLSTVASIISSIWGREDKCATFLASSKLKYFLSFYSFVFYKRIFLRHNSPRIPGRWLIVSHMPGPAMAPQVGNPIQVISSLCPGSLPRSSVMLPAVLFHSLICLVSSGYLSHLMYLLVSSCVFTCLISCNYSLNSWAHLLDLVWLVPTVSHTGYSLSHLACLLISYESYLLGLMFTYLICRVYSSQRWCLLIWSNLVAVWSHFFTCLISCDLILFSTV